MIRREGSFATLPCQEYEYQHDTESAKRGRKLGYVTQLDEPLSILFCPQHSEWARDTSGREGSVTPQDFPALKHIMLLVSNL